MISYEAFQSRSSFDQTEVLAFAHGVLLHDPPEGLTARFPLPPLLMVDRIVEIRRNHPRGRMVAERDVRLDDWFFQCHFAGDPVQPGCLGVDAIWQLLGFFCVWNGALGSGRALGCKEVVFEGQIRPRDEVVRYEIDIRRFSNLPDSGAAIAIGDGAVLVDGQRIYCIKDAKVGVFRDIAYPSYPTVGPRARGGLLSRG